MEPELIEIQNFIAQYSPFSSFEESELVNLAQKIEISYVRKDTPIIQHGEAIHDLYVVRSGAVELYRRNGELYHRMDEGAIFGQMGLLTNNRVRFSATAIEDSLLYCIPEQTFSKLYESQEAFADFMEVDDSVRLRNTVSMTSDQNDLTTYKLRKLLTREPVKANKNESIHKVALMMAEENVSSVLIIDPEADDKDSLLGIVTDRDLCTRVLAKNLDISLPISLVVSPDVRSLDHNAYVYEAMLMMLQHHVHHLPIMKNNQPIGIIETTDIIRYESQNSLLLVNSIYLQQNLDDLERVSKQVKDSFVRMVNEDANAHMIGSAMAVIGRSFKQRIIELAEQELGEPPIPYCFLALGSMGRDEQLIVTDQDNAIMLDDSYVPTLHGEYFEKLATYVCDGLDRCGYDYCSGDIMASNPQWRMTCKEWEACFLNWIEEPTPQALLNASIFFDLQGVHGQVKWADKLNRLIVKHAKSNRKFLACLARNALNRTPPLGFFKEFVMEKDGQHNNSINLKRRGTAPLADLIRVHALAVGSHSRNSFERLDDIEEAKLLPESKAQDLRDAMEFIAMVRIRHQAMDVELSIEPDNNIEPDNISDFDRRNLKDAFQILSRAQNFLKYRYTASSSFS